LKVRFAAGCSGAGLNFREITVNNCDAASQTPPSSHCSDYYTDGTVRNAWKGGEEVCETNPQLITFDTYSSPTDNESVNHLTQTGVRERAKATRC